MAGSTKRITRKYEWNHEWIKNPVHHPGRHSIGQPGRGGAVREVLEAYMLSLWQHRERCLAA